ncbi:MAG: hypothetical protein EOO75_21565 [Myxococcales bacterium]|nr:MAG: hypothetical protein EOO75_21565 [Myxococcales bacterium]
MALAVSVDQHPEMVYAAPRIELGHGPPSDVLVARGAWATSERWWLERDGEQVWLTSRRDLPGGHARASGPSTPVRPDTPLTLGQSRVSVRALPDRSEPSSHDVELASAAGAPGPALVELLARRSELSARVAANTSAPSGLLERLGQSCDRATLEALAGNPSAPFAVVLRLAPMFPAAFWGNPQVLLLLLTDPTLGSLSAYALASLISHPAAPVDLLPAFAAHPSAAVREFVQRALAARQA